MALREHLGALPTRQVAAQLWLALGASHERGVREAVHAYPALRGLRPFCLPGPLAGRGHAAVRPPLERGGQLGGLGLVGPNLFDLREQLGLLGVGLGVELLQPLVPGGLGRGALGLERLGDPNARGVERGPGVGNLAVPEGSGGLQGLVLLGTGGADGLIAGRPEFGAAGFLGLLGVGPPARRR